MAYTGIRRFEAEDVPAVAELHRRVMRAGRPESEGWLQEYHEYFRDVFLNDAALSSSLSSLVYQREGRILGFLGVMPRRMQFEGRPLLAAVCSQFVVDPAERGQAGLQMLKRCLAGNQDVSLTDEAAECTRKIWEWCGGVAALPYSIHWMRPIRPAQAALSFAGLGMLKPIARAIDAIATRPGWRFHPLPPPGSRALVDKATLLECLADGAKQCSLGPHYDEASVQWVLERIGRHRDQGAVRALVVKDDAGGVAGWFIYHARRGGPGEVLQVSAQPRQHRAVLDHLFEDAWQQGVTMVRGRLEPSFAPHLSENAALLYRRGYWTLVHSKRAEICNALQRGDAFFSRLEGEWCLRFS